jgi:transposase-like protein
MVANAMPDGPETLLEAVRFFSDEDVALRFAIPIRWENGVPTCPHCASIRASFLSTRRIWKCLACRKQYSLKIGTVLEDSPISLTKWLPAMWLLANCKNGISSYELARALDVTQKTAWFMLHRLRHAMADLSTDKFSGDVEIDETYIGGKVTNMHAKQADRARKAGKWAGKQAVLGVLERHGEGTSRVRTRLIGTTKRKELFGAMKEEIIPGTNIYTDALPSYASLNHVFVHQFIDHTESYAAGAVHTNGLENFWSLVKRCIRGTYVAVEPFHLLRYLDEQAFRFNARKVTDAMRFRNVLGQIAGRRLTYKTLIGQAAPERC